MNSPKRNDQGRRLLTILVQTIEIGIILMLAVVVFLLWQRLQQSTQQVAVVQATVAFLEQERLALLSQPTATPVPALATEPSAAGDSELLSFSDPNDPSALNPMFSWQPGNAGANAYDLTLEPGTLTLIAGAGTEQWQFNNTNPFVILPASGNFDVSVKVKSSLFENYQRSGIGIRSAQDVNTWVSISLNYHGGIEGSRGIMVFGNQQGNSNILSSAAFAGEECFFKIERRGPTISLSYSEDGTTWIPLQENYVANFGDPVEIFLMAFSTSGSGVTAQFSDLSVSMQP